VLKKKKSLMIALKTLATQLKTLATATSSAALNLPDQHANSSNRGPG
jgi:hypothetical protein